MTTSWINKEALRGLGVLCLYAISFFLVAACSSSGTVGGELEGKAEPNASSAKPLITKEATADPAKYTVETPRQRNEKRRDVLYYFRNLPNDYALPYRIWQEDRLWMSEHLSTGKIQQALVDLKNGYLEVAHLVENGVSENVQVALFRMENNAPVIGLCQTQTHNDQVQQSCHFLRPEDELQLDWTEYALPVFTPFDFFSPEAEARLDNDYKDDAFPILIKLPQHGTDLRVQLYLGRRFHYCSDEASEQEKQLCPLFDEMERRSFALKWNRRSGQFN